MKNKIEIIAEIAQGYEGSEKLADLLIKGAIASNADAVKFQLVYADELATPDYKYYNLFKGLEMPDKVWMNLINYANESGIEFIFDVFGIKSLQLAERLGSKTVMLHATDITNFALINRVSSGPIERVILGSGGAHLSEIQNAVDALPNKNICIMLGFQGYPTPDEDNQISRIKYMISWIKGKYSNITVGFADHSLPNSNLLSSLSAMALGAGASSFEKHLTLSQVMKLEDYESAINPDQFYDYCNQLRECLKALGEVKEEPDFGMSNSEKGYRKFVRRHIITADYIPEGVKVTENHFVFKRSSLDGAITNLEDIIGREALLDLEKNHPVTLGDFK